MTVSEQGDVPREVLAEWGLEEGFRCGRLTTGLINRTYLVEDTSRRWVLQCLHPIFSGELHADIHAVTSHLERKGLPTPRLVPTRDGRLWCSHRGEVWRLQTYLEGRVFSEMPDPELAHQAGRAVARFHAALVDLHHDFHFSRPGVHDLARHLGRLSSARDAANMADPELGEVMPLAAAILEHADELPRLPSLPQRIVHGDLKLTNLLFEVNGAEVAVIDLDTLAQGTLATELGDALRSWCNPRGESDPAAEVDPQLFAAAVEGYAAGSASFVTPEEVVSLRPGTEIIALELASRFCLDALEDQYFGWDPARFPSRRAHNVVRARSQLALARSLRERSAQLDASVARAFGQGGPTASA